MKDDVWQPNYRLEATPRGDDLVAKGAIDDFTTALKPVEHLRQIILRYEVVQSYQLILQKLKVGSRERNTLTMSTH